MSTDLFGVRVLDIDHERREVHFRVFVVYYDSACESYLSPPESDWSFFLGLLWESGRWDGAIGRAMDVDQVLDEGWAAANARWIVADVQLTARRNDPPSPDDWLNIKDFYYERDGHWADEDILVQADYVVRVTHPCWIEHLKAGDAWGSAFYPRYADKAAAEDLPHVPDLRSPATVLTPFDGTEISDLCFSDDGRHLAVLDADGALVVYETADWSELVRAEPESEFGIRLGLMWVPDGNVVTRKDYWDEDQQSGFDVDTRTWVDVPLERGHRRSRTGRHRIEYGDAFGVKFLDGPTVLDADDPGITIEHAAFTADESRLFAAGGSPDVFVLDPSTGEVLETFPDAERRVWSLTVSPAGTYLVTSEPTYEPEGERSEIRVRRTSDHLLVGCHRRDGFVAALDWSPDDRWLVARVTETESGDDEVLVLPIGLPTEPPESLRPVERTSAPPPESGVERAVAPPRESGIDAEMVRVMALASDPVTQDELDHLVMEHRRWLYSGGGGGTWQVVSAASLPLAVYNGPAGTEGAQAVLRYSRFEDGADLRVSLPWADLTGLVGNGLDLRGADLRNATVTDAHLRGARLNGADLSGADFSRADLTGADLSGADLTGADFENADLTGAKGI